MEIGVLFAFGALLFWGFGDFFIQRTTRKIGDWETLFAITFWSSLFITPIVYKKLPGVLSLGYDTTILAASSIALLLAGLSYFEALKRGKIAVVEPILALEVPVSAVLAYLVVKEAVTFTEGLLVLITMTGIALVSLQSHHFKKKSWLEPGAALALAGAFLMGLSNFLVGLAARVTDPLLTIWFGHVVITLFCIAYFMREGRVHTVIRDARNHPRLVATVCALDSMAWISFAYAMAAIPIAIAVALSESYIALAALLGLVVNKERLLAHQKFGLALTLAGAVALAVMVS